MRNTPTYDKLKQAHSLVESVLDRVEVTLNPDIEEDFLKIGKLITEVIEVEFPSKYSRDTW